TRAGGEVVMDLPNASDVAATYRLTWTGPAGWFGGKTPASEARKLAAGESVRRTYKLSREPDAVSAPPAMELAYEFTRDGQTVRGRDMAEVFVRPVVSASAVRGIRVDGRLEDWGAAAGRAMGARWQVRDNPKEWTGPADCSAVVRIGYDAANLYVAVDVTDDALLVANGAAWQIDGVEVFWDGRATTLRGGPYGEGCGHAAVPLSAADAQAKPEAAGDKAPPVRTACRRREGGYVVEMAIPLAAIGGGFKPARGAVLRTDVLINDKDDGDEKAPTACMSLSGYTKCNYRTWRYAEVRFE
ncbi:MAG TPA: sugar-binding protein, partial [Phycisphaerae bacterium]|nr:sugar-binding protein [Phycisphaerae bacterium]